MFPKMIVLPMKFLGVVFSFDELLLRNFRDITTLAEYWAKNIHRVKGDRTEHISSQPELETEDVAIRGFIPRGPDNLKRGSTIVRRARVIIALNLGSILRRIRGAIFCQVIIRAIELLWNFKEGINLRYQECTGHTPIFSLSLIKARRVFHSEDFDTIVVTSTIEAIAWIRKYMAAGLIVSFTCFVSLEIKKHMTKVFNSNVAHTITQDVEEAIIKVEINTMLFILLESLALKKQRSFKLEKFIGL